MINLPPLRPMPVRHLQYFQHIQCSRGCTGHAHFGNGIGLRWCVRCYSRFLLVDQVLTRYDWLFLDGKAIARSHMSEWVKFARTGSASEIEQALKVMEGVA